MCLFLDYDGTLVPIHHHPGEALLGEHVRSVLKRVSKHERLQIVLVSGRVSSFLESQFAGLDVDMAAEHGAMFYSAASGNWRPVIKSSRGVWFTQGQSLFEEASRQVQGCFVEKKECSVAWHYRQAAPQPSAEMMGYLRNRLMELTKEGECNLLEGKKVMELRAKGADKGFFLLWYLQQARMRDAVVTLAVGDDETDEEMFIAAHSIGGLSLKVGAGESAAEYRVSSTEQVTTLLEFLADELC